MLPLSFCLSLAHFKFRMQQHILISCMEGTQNTCECVICIEWRHNPLGLLWRFLVGVWILTRHASDTLAGDCLTSCDCKLYNHSVSKPHCLNGMLIKQFSEELLRNKVPVFFGKDHFVRCRAGTWPESSLLCLMCTAWICNHASRVLGIINQICLRVETWSQGIEISTWHLSRQLVFSDDSCINL